jgi:hypothetical protein
MSTVKENIRKKLFIKLYSERDSRQLIPGSDRAVDLIDTLRHDGVKKIYIISSSQSISWPYINLFQKLGGGVAVRDLILEKIDRQDIYTLKSIIDDINISIKRDEICEIILFNGNLAGIVLGCFYVNGTKNTDYSIEQVKKTIPNIILSGSDISFIKEFNEFIGGVRKAAPDIRVAPEDRRVYTARETAPVVEKKEKQETGAIKELDVIRNIIDQAEPAGVLTRFRIATKFIALISLIMVFSLSLMIFLGTEFFKRDSASKIYASNAVVARLIGDRLQDEIFSSLEKARFAADISSLGRSSDDLAARVKEMLFREKSNFIFMGIAKKEIDGLRFGKTFHDQEYINNNQITREMLRGALEKNSEYFIQSFNDRIIIRNISPDMGLPVLGISFPYKHREGAVSSVIVCYVPLERFMDASRVTGPARTFMVNDRGDCVVDAERNRVLSRVSMADVPIVRKMLISTTNSGEMRYRDIDGLYHFGSYQKLGMFGLGVIVTAAEDRMLRGVYDIQRRNFIILAIVLLAAILGAFIFSKTISAPIDSLRQLADAAPSGNLKLAAPGEGDEIFYLTQSFREVLRSYLDSRMKLDAYPATDDAVSGAAGETPGGTIRPGQEYSSPSAAAPARDMVSQQFRTEGLKIEVTYDGPKVVMLWRGKGNIGNPGELLNPYLEGIINSLRGRDLTCDFSSLDIMNASVVQSIIKFAQILDENRIQARFVYNKSIDWQDASFEALGAVVQEMDTISLDGRQLEKNLFILQ